MAETHEFDYQAVEGEETDIPLEVSDEEGHIDRKIKNRILASRKRIDTAEEKLFVDKLGSADYRSPEEYQELERQLADRWGVVVRQYVRAVMPLLKDQDIEKADYYWNRAPIYETAIAPPDGTHEWSRFTGGKDDVTIARGMGLPPLFDPPEPKTLEVIGLNEILEKKETTCRWDIVLNPGAIPPRQNVDSLALQVTLPKRAYERAVEYTDEFLQQAGVGLSLSKPQTNVWEV